MLFQQIFLINFIYIPLGDSILVLKTSIKSWGSSFFIIFLLLNQVFFIVVTSSESSFSNRNNINSQSLNPIESLEINDFIDECVDLLVVDDFVLADYGNDVDFLDISNPSFPELLYNYDNYGQKMKAYTNFDNIVLFGLGDFENNYSIMKIDLDVNSTVFSEISVLFGWLYQMSLTNDTLYSFSGSSIYYLNEFLIHNATDIDNLSLLGNTTLAGIESNVNFLVHEDYVYFTSEGRNLSIYQVNSSYQLSFVKQYYLTNLESIYFYEDYLLICFDFGFQVFNYSNPSNLSLVTQYNIPSAQSIRIRNDIAFLTTSDSFTILDLSNILNPQILDQYIIGDREYTEMWKIELSDNLAIILTEELRRFDYPGQFGGYLYIFDVSSLSEIERLYPTRLPKYDGFTLLMLKLIVPMVTIPIFIVILLVVPKLIDEWKKKQQKEKELYFKNEM